MIKRNLKSLTSKIKKYDIVAFDIEGDADNFVCGCVYDKNGPKNFINKKEMGNYLTSRKFLDSRIFATNLQYDLPILYQDNFEDFELLMVKSKLITAKYIYQYGAEKNKRKQYIKFFDTTNITPFFSVKKMGEIINLPKLKHDITNAKTLKWSKKLEKYCERDAKITFNFVIYY